MVFSLDGWGEVDLAVLAYGLARSPGRAGQYRIRVRGTVVAIRHHFWRWRRGLGQFLARQWWSSFELVNNKWLNVQHQQMQYTKCQQVRGSLPQTV